MTTPERCDDRVVESIVELKRKLTDLKLEALLRSGGTAPTTSSHDLDAIVAEAVTGLDERRRARPPISDDCGAHASTTQACGQLRTPSNR